MTFKWLICAACLSVTLPLQAVPPFIYDYNQFDVPSYESIAKKIVPSISYGTIRYSCNGFEAGEIVEILEDVGQGQKYRVTNNLFATWVYQDALEIHPTTFIALPELTSEELEVYLNHDAPTSLTPYFIWVDLARQKVYVFENQDNYWHLFHQMSCASGKSTTPTCRGNFTLIERKEVLEGRERVKYWVKFYKNYLFHSLPVNALDEVIDSRLCEPVSNGCIRLKEEDAKWIFDTLPNTTSVWIN